MNFFWSYNNTSKESFKYGKIYNGYVIKDSRGICPSGWHIPTDAEWKALCIALDPDAADPTTNTAGGAMKEAGYVYWSSPNTGATNSSGFNARAAGIRDETFGAFSEYGSHMRIWQNKDIAGLGLAISSLIYTSESFITGFTSDYWKRYRAGCSIRLIKDDANDPGVMTDNEGNVYPTIKIDNQVWMAVNYKSGHYNNGDAIANLVSNSDWTTATGGGWCHYNNDLQYE